jgi:hypothetical protein
MLVHIRRITEAILRRPWIAYRIAWIVCAVLRSWRKIRGIPRKYAVFRARECRYAIFLLAAGVNKDGKPIDLAKLNTGRKCIAELLTEIVRGEARLLVHADGYVFRGASSLKIYIRVGDYVLRETKRDYGNGDVDERVRDYAISETWMRGEELRQGALRGLLEELGIRIRTFLLKLRHNEMTYDRHPSSAYQTLESAVVTYRVDLTLKKRPRAIRFGRIIVDNGVRIHVAWFYEPLVRTADSELEVTEKLYRPEEFVDMFLASMRDLPPEDESSRRLKKIIESFS